MTEQHGRCGCRTEYIEAVCSVAELDETIFSLTRDLIGRAVETGDRDRTQIPQFHFWYPPLDVAITAREKFARSMGGLDTATLARMDQARALAAELGGDGRLVVGELHVLGRSCAGAD